MGYTSFILKFTINIYVYIICIYRYPYIVCIHIFPPGDLLLDIYQHNCTHLPSQWVKFSALFHCYLISFSLPCCFPYFLPFFSLYPPFAHLISSKITSSVFVFRDSFLGEFSPYPTTVSSGIPSLYSHKCLMD